MPDVVVVGGGIAGLATAFELHKQGISFVILERGPRAGGVILSEQVDDYTIDAGPDALLTQKPEGIRLCEELGLGDRLVPTKPPRVAFIQRRGRLYRLPTSSVLGIPTRVGPFLRTKLFTWRGKMRMGAELFVAQRLDASDESIGSFMRRRFGDEATDYLAEPLLAGIHAGDVNRLSVRSLFPRFTEAERTHGSLLRAFRSQPRGTLSVDGPFRSLPDGLSGLVRALVAALPSGSLRLDTPVAYVASGSSRRGPDSGARAHPGPDSSAGTHPAKAGSHEGEMFRVTTALGESLGARAVVVSTPAYVTAELVSGIDSDLSRLCREIPYASTGTVALAFPRSAVAHPLNGSGFVVPRLERTGILAATWLSSKWPNRAPDDCVLIRTFVGGARDPQALDRSDAELVSVSLSALRPIIGIAGEPLFARVYRFEQASAQHEIGHLERLEEIERALSQTKGLFITGSGFRGIGIPDCVADARRTAQEVVTWLGSRSQQS